MSLPASEASSSSGTRSSGRSRATSTSPSSSSTWPESPSARPPEIAESREVPVAEALEARWISSLSRLAIQRAVRKAPGWPRSTWDGGEVPGLSTEAFHGDVP